LDEEELIVWQDVLDSIMAGRAEGLRCPACAKGFLEVTTEIDGTTKIRCLQCGKFLQGRFG
jgi:uncharacterized Zn finger protein